MTIKKTPLVANYAQVDEVGDFCFFIVCKDAALCSVVTTTNFIAADEAEDAGAEFEVWAILREADSGDITGVHDCMVVDISLGGCMLEGDFHMRNGMGVAVGFGALMGLLGEIVNAGPGLVGVKFYSEPDRRSDIRAWIAARLKIARAGGDSSSGG